MRRALLLFPVLAWLCAAPPAAARDATAGVLVITQAYTKATPPGARTAGAYLTIENRGAVADQLVGARSTAAAAVELHTMSMEGGVMRMRAVPRIEIPPGGSVRLAPGALHLMIIDPKAPLREHERFPVTLTFARAGAIDVELTVEPMK